jgi:hypothetical protein
MQKTIVIVVVAVVVVVIRIDGLPPPHQTNINENNGGPQKQTPSNMIKTKKKKKKVKKHLLLFVFRYLHKCSRNHPITLFTCKTFIVPQLIHCFQRIWRTAFATKTTTIVFLCMAICTVRVIVVVEEDGLQEGCVTEMAGKTMLFGGLKQWVKTMAAGLKQ